MIKKLSLIIVTGLFAVTVTYAQKSNWHNLDKTRDSVMGISTEKAYRELLQGKKATSVLVAVIDAGVDTAHEDLKAVLWHNPKEKVNRKDDDKNGYADDTYGWSFIGSAKGNVGFDNTELVRQVKLLQPKFEGKDPATIAATDKPAFERYQKQKSELNKQLREAQHNLVAYKGFAQVVDAIVKKIGKDNPTVADFGQYQAQGPQETRIREVMIAQLNAGIDYKQFRDEQLDKGIKHFQEEVDYHLNIAFDPRGIVGDNYADGKQRTYGSNDVTGPDPDHGTHVSGIIGAVRDNDLGVKGVADHVQIMTIRTVPNGDERDKDVANAIRYAADNGAKVINMSFGKAYSGDKKLVDDAVKYAVSKDVLLIHAAGNDNKNLDTIANFPNRIYDDKSGVAAAWIEVGASGFKDDESLKAPFSNYGKTSVDVFAPGVAIYSTVPGSKYENHDGTSMACPVVAGLAALIREYYPKLTAVQVKDVIMRSVVKINHNVTIPGKDGAKSLAFADLCISGGIVNAYRALQLAEHYAPLNTQLN